MLVRSHRYIVHQRGVFSHLLAIYTPVIRLDDHKALASNMQTLTLHLLHAIGALVLVCRYDCLHFLWRHCETGGGGPHAVAFAVEDGGLVEVLGAYEGSVDICWKGDFSVSFSFSLQCSAGGVVELLACY